MFLCDLDGYTARTGRKATLTLDSLEKQFHTFLLEVYHRRPSSEGKLSPKEPQANVKTSRAFKSELSPLDNQTTRDQLCLLIPSRVCLSFLRR
jgi:hypothetical protein